MPPTTPARCFWVVDGPPLYHDYHDREWGFPVADDRRLFEKLSLEAFQSGLSWLTILKKREGFREAFAGFDVARVARFGARDVARLLADAGIVRHRGKIEATIANARALESLLDVESSFAAYVWRFAPPAATQPRTITEAWLRAASTSPEATALSKDLKRRGFRFVGPTTVQAFLQAAGLVNHHESRCHVRAAAEAARRAFVVPTSGAK
ncbi:MAG: DNA-3-methyladenine glycosylase I [Gemmatimonadaceae bacterium]|nr:DNA-3-methyladenine glycosylase I [Gemmatimonadaceae bacterium]